jgi:Cu(I)/Ag(I) efflux system membrane protein CusA/SilA
MMVMTAVGGDNQTTTVMGRERYGVSVRYARDYREDLSALRRVLLPLQGGRGQIPMEEIATVELVQGPSMIRDENGLLAGYVYVDFDTSRTDVGRYVALAKEAVKPVTDHLPAGYSLTWSGQYENMLRVKERLKVILPLTLVLIFGLLYLNTRSAFKASIVMLAVPFSATTSPSPSGWGSSRSWASTPRPASSCSSSSTSRTTSTGGRGSCARRGTWWRPSSTGP